MILEMQKANLLAENLKLFIDFVNKSHENKNSLRVDPDKVYQLKLLVEEYQLPSLADELTRINLHTWDEKYTLLLVERIQKGMQVIEEYEKRHHDELFLYSGRIHIVKNLCNAIK